MFQHSVLVKYRKQLDEIKLNEAFDKFQDYFGNPQRQSNIREAKEEQFQEGFLRELFVNILGYTLNPEPSYNLTTEFKNEKGSKKADGAVLTDGKAIAVIELKGTDTKDLDRINDQAFGYKNNHDGCSYVVTSNFEKLRFYINNAVEHIEFNLFNLNKLDFEVLWICLASENLLSHIPLKIKEESITVEENVTKQLYKDYSQFKTDLWQNMVKNRPKEDQLTLYKKSQKLLDRFLFIFFSEDSGLLPPNSISRMEQRWRTLKDEDAYKPLYEIFKQYFGYINTGRKGKTPQDDIYAYNGGLFQEDEILDSITIDDEVLQPHVMKLTAYDFSSEIDVNILGHIFENSLNEIENVKAQLEGIEIDKSKTKRKKDGVFYTPKYITKYIVDNTVGKLCDEKKNELGIVDEEYAKGRKYRKKDIIKSLDDNLQKYRDWLLQITICDPACGSGAFLNQALEFLIAEHLYIDELQVQLLEQSIMFQDVRPHILENNLYGVDINEESVEIAKLSLWLRTAHKDRKLTSLSNNIKCGNSLIDDPDVAGDKAFKWEEEFPSVFANGGFQVVIGNPPYVRQELIRQFKDYFEIKYSTYNSSADLYTYFIEISLNRLLNKDGIYSVIVANKWLRSNYGSSLRNWLVKKNITEIIDFKDLPVFQGIAAYPCILTVNNEGSNKFFKSTTLNTLEFDDLELYVKKHFVSVNKTTLNPSAWSLEDESDGRLIKRLNDINLKLKSFIDGKMYVGLKTGYNEAFIISEHQYKAIINESRHYMDIIKPYAVGRDITKYGTPIISRYLICFPSKWTNSKGDFTSEKEAWDWIKNNYPLIAVHLEEFKDKCISRSDKGEYWWELRACDYYDEFNKSKIIYPEISSEGRFTLDFENLYCDMTAFIIGNHSTYLLSLLNSKLITYYIKRTSSEIRGGFLRWKRQYLYPIPIIVPSDSIQKEIDTNVKTIMTLTKKSQDIIREFHQLLLSKFDIEKLSNKLQSWNRLEFSEVLNELKKFKVSISLSEESEWLQFFNEKKNIVQDLHIQIDQSMRYIDKIIYQLYSLNEEEIKIVEAS